MPRFRVRLTKTVEIYTDLDVATVADAERIAKSRYPDYSTAEVKEATPPRPCPCFYCRRMRSASRGVPAAL